MTDEQGAGLAEALRALDHMPTRLEVEAERAFLRTLEAGCSAPIGVSACVQGDALHIEARIVSLDGSRLLGHSVDVELDGDDAAKAAEQAQQAGEDVGRYLLDNGARDITLLSATKNTDEKTLWG